MRTRQGIILVGLTVTLLGLSGILGYGPLAAACIAPTAVDWTTLHGADFKYFLTRGDTGYSPPPSVSFPLMVNRNFNFIRVPFTWLEYDQSPSAFLAKVDAISSAADANGISVIWCFQGSFPLSITGTLDDHSSAFLVSWWQNQIPNGWTLMMQNFWGPIIAHVDSHPSTLGYELFNEPPLYSAPITAMQAHNQYFATQIRALSSKTILFMGAGSDGFFYDGSSIVAVAPTISNIGVDVHSYDDYSGELGRVSGWVGAAKTIPAVGGHVVVG